jgi:hypothetical protein
MTPTELRAAMRTLPARTVLALLEAAGEGVVARKPPASAASLVVTLRYQVGDLHELPGLIPPRVALSGGLPTSRGGYVYGALDDLPANWNGGMR